jgi:hypothetical protein
LATVCSVYNSKDIFWNALVLSKICTYVSFLDNNHRLIWLLWMFDHVNHYYQQHFMHLWEFKSNNGNKFVQYLKNFKDCDKLNNCDIASKSDGIFRQKMSSPNSRWYDSVRHHPRIKFCFLKKHLYISYKLITFT